MPNSFTTSEIATILRLKSSIASHYSLQMKKLNNRHALESQFLHSCVISGGCISSLFHKEPVKDIDIYAKDFKSMSSIKDHIIKLCDGDIKSVDDYDITTGQPIKDTDLKLITQNAVTLVNDVQFVYLAPWQTAKDNFDMLHCTPHYDLATNKLYISRAQFDAILHKEIVPWKEGPMKRWRVSKYQERGWKIKDDVEIEYEKS